MKILTLTLVAVSLIGCVSRGRYDQAVTTTEITRAELKERDAALGRERGTSAKLKAEIDALDQRNSSDSTRISELQKRLGELQAAERATEARAALYKSITLKLRQQIDNGDLTVAIRDGRMVLALSDDVLFDTGRTDLKPGGRLTLSAVAEVMKSMPTRQFQVAGHTDNVPIHTSHFASNWELSSARALRVVHYLIGEGAPEPMLSAAGYSDTDPVASNATNEGRQKNRRTEITLEPNIDELVKVPE